LWVREEILLEWIYYLDFIVVMSIWFSLSMYFVSVCGCYACKLQLNFWLMLLLASPLCIPGAWLMIWTWFWSSMFLLSFEVDIITNS
jgi:uncharacterized membrane protein